MKVIKYGEDMESTYFDGEKEIAIYVLTTSSYEDCLYDYISKCSDPLRTWLSVNVGHTSRLYIEQKFWNEIPEGQQDLITSEARGFVDGWEMAYETRRNH